MSVSKHTSACNVASRLVCASIVSQSASWISDPRQHPGTSMQDKLEVRTAVVFQIHVRDGGPVEVHRGLEAALPERCAYGAVLLSDEGMPYSIRRKTR